MQSDDGTSTRVVPESMNGLPGDYYSSVPGALVGGAQAQEEDEPTSAPQLSEEVRSSKASVQPLSGCR